MSAAQELWLGYRQSGGRESIRVDGASKVLVLGSRADEIAALASLSMKEAGARPILLDFRGFLSSRLSGYFETFDYRSFLYDAFRLEEPGSWHAQLAASAYAVALDLTSEEEAIINSAMQQLAAEDNLVSPVSVYDIMGKVEGFRGFYVDKLKGRIGSLRLFDAVDDQAFNRLTAGGVLVDFHRAPYPQAAELAMAMFIAKVLAVEHATKTVGAPVVITEAHRLFKSAPRPSHANRLLTEMMESTRPTFLSSDQQQALSPQVLKGCAVRILSSDSWHLEPGNRTPVLPGSFVVHDGRSGRSSVFVPRRVSSKSAGYVSSRAAGGVSSQLTVMILEQVEKYELSTRESMVQFLTPEFLAADINDELDRLHSRECLVVEPKDSGSGPRIFAYTITENGISLLRELRG